MRTVLTLAALTAVVFAGGADKAAALLEKQDYEGAVKAARAAIDADKTNVDAWVVLADAHVGRGEPVDAWTQLEGAIEANPKSAALRVKLGDVFVKLAEKEQGDGGDGMTIDGYYLDALRLYDEALEIQPKNADAYHGKANVTYWRARDDYIGDAHALLAKALEIDAEHGPSHALQADLLYTEGSKIKELAARIAMLQSASQKFEIAAKLFEGEPRFFVRWGHACYGAGKRDAALAAYIEGLKRFPTNDMPIRSGFDVLAGKKDDKYVPRMIAMLEQAGEAVPASPVVWFHLGYWYEQAKRLPDALTAYGKAQKLDPANAVYVFFGGKTLEAMDQKDKALAVYLQAIELNPAYQAPATQYEWVVRSSILPDGNLQKLSPADLATLEQHYEKLLKLAPDHGWIRNNYALLLRDWAELNGGRGTSAPAATITRLKRACVVYEEAARLLPDEPQVLSDTGLMFEFYPSTFEPEKAHGYFTRSLEKSTFLYRDAFDGLNRLCRKTKDWATLSEYAEYVLGEIERGGEATGPVGGGVPQGLGANETRGLELRATEALALANQNLKSGG